MTTPSESPAPVIVPSPKLLQLLRWRLRQLSRVAVILAIGLAIVGAALVVGWLTSLNGLPDIGDPFDVAELRAFRIPDDQNAFTDFRRANERLGDVPLSPGKLDRAATVAWSLADPETRDWVEANGPALGLFLRGAECPDGISRRPGGPYSGRHSEDLGPRYLILLALLEGGRRAEGGDAEGAWACYRAVLRATAYSARRGTTGERFFAVVHRGWLLGRLDTWAADPRTTIPQLRRALEEVVETRPRPEWDAFSLGIEYLEWMRQLETMHHPDRDTIEEEGPYRLGEMELPQDVAASLYHARRLLLREPERSRRAIRLLFANWVARADGPPVSRRPPVVHAFFRCVTSGVSVPLYPVGPAAPAGARVLSPDRVAGWLVSAHDLKGIARNGSWHSVRRGEQSGYRAMVTLLTAELYRRERGTPPPSEEALVGTYLESLPEDGSADLPDGKTSRVE